MPKKTITITLIVCAAVLFILIVFLTIFSPNILSSLSEDQGSSVTANIDFSSEKIDYPTDWPESLILPDEIMLVEYASGSALENKTQGWSGKFRFEGTLSSLENILRNHFESEGWKIEKIGDGSSNGFVLLLQKDEGDGLIVVDTDPENTKQKIVAISFFP